MDLAKKVSGLGIEDLGRLRLVAVFVPLVLFLAGLDIYMGEEDGDGFEDMTESIEDNRALRRYGLASVQVGNETMVYATGFGGPNSLMKWRDGGLVEDTPESLRDPETNAIGAAGCDIDGDGQEEIYVLTTGGQFGGRKGTSDRLYDLQDGSWVDLFQDSDVVNRYAGRSVACTYTPDGYGFFVARYGGPMQLVVERNGSLEDVAPDYRMDRTTGGRSIVNIPTEDGIDIFVGNEQGPNFYYLNRLDSYREVGSELGVADTRLPARGATVYDMGEDGDLDLAIANWNSPHRLYRNTGDGFEDVATEEFSEPTPARSLVAADFDNNGRTELFLNNIASRGKAPNRLFDSEGKALAVGDAREPSGLGTGATVADLNQDGTLELVIAHGEAGAQPLTMYSIPNNESAVRIQPVWSSGAPARASYVKVKETGAVYPVDGGSAYLNQMEPWAHIGNREPPLEVEVVFPDGKTVEKNVTSSKSKILYPDSS